MHLFKKRSDIEILNLDKDPEIETTTPLKETIIFQIEMNPEKFGGIPFKNKIEKNKFYEDFEASIHDRNYKGEYRGGTFIKNIGDIQIRVSYFFDYFMRYPVLANIFCVIFSEWGKSMESRFKITVLGNWNKENDVFFVDPIAMWFQKNY